MSGGVLGGGVIFVVAALLWAAVLVPTWLRRREFRAAERNAIRLQRTLRVLAETSEVPTEVRVEATAREALAQEKLLRTAQRRQEAEREAKLAAERAEQVRAEIRAQQIRRKQAAMQRAAKLRRPIVRRIRATAALAALLGLVGLLVGAGLALGGNGVMVLAGAALLASIGTGTLVLLAPGRVRAQTIEAEEIAVSIGAEETAATDEPEAESQDVDAATAAHAAAQQAAAARIARAQALARARADRPALKENQPDSILLREAREQVVQVREQEAQAREQAAHSRAAENATEQAAPVDSQAATQRRADAVIDAAIEASVAKRTASTEQTARLRNMGVIGDTSDGMPDLDEVLRRRRNAS